MKKREIPKVTPQVMAHAVGWIEVPTTEVGSGFWETRG